MTNFSRFIRELKEIVDAQTGVDYRAHGPLRTEFSTILDDKRKQRCCMRIDCGWDENYGGHVYIEASPTGRSLRVQVFDPEGKQLW